MSAYPDVVDLNVGGENYSVSLITLVSISDSLLGQQFSQPSKLPPPPLDSKKRYFIDRDGLLFRFIIDYLRNQMLILPENFAEKSRLAAEAAHFRLPGLLRILGVGLPVAPQTGSVEDGDVAMENNESYQRESGNISLGYRGTFAFGRDGQSDVKFRKLSRLVVSGRVCLCREVFGDTLNESRDPDRGSSSRYTSRFFLKHLSVEQAFDALVERGFTMCGSTASGTNSNGELKAGQNDEESRWNHYTEYIFVRKL